MPRRSAIGHLVGPDVEASIDGGRIAAHDFPAEPCGERYAERALAGGRRSEDGHEPRRRSRRQRRGARNRPEHEQGQQQRKPDLLGSRRPGHRPGGCLLKKNVTVISIRSSGYSGGNGIVGLEVRIAFRPESVKALIADGRDAPRR